MSAERDLDDCAAQSAKAVEELAELRGEIARLDAERKQALSVLDQQALDLLDRAAAGGAAADFVPATRRSSRVGRDSDGNC